MPRLLQFSAEGGDVVIAVREPGEQFEAAGLTDTVIEKIERSLDDVFRMVGSVATSFVKELQRRPIVASAELEFGIQFVGKGTIYVVESEAQASLKVKLTLNQGAPAPAGAPSTSS